MRSNRVALLGLGLVTVYLWHRPEPLILTQRQPLRPPLHYRGYCGTTLADANARCGTSCPLGRNDSACPDGEHCFSGVTNCSASLLGAAAASAAQAALRVSANREAISTAEPMPPPPQPPRGIASAASAAATSPPLLFVAVLSARGNFQRRTALRNHMDSQYRPALHGSHFMELPGVKEAVSMQFIVGAGCAIPPSLRAPATGARPKAGGITCRWADGHRCATLPSGAPGCELLELATADPEEQALMDEQNTFGDLVRVPSVDEYSTSAAKMAAFAAELHSPTRAAAGGVGGSLLAVAAAPFVLKLDDDNVFDLARILCALRHMQLEGLSSAAAAAQQNEKLSAACVQVGLGGPLPGLLLPAATQPPEYLWWGRFSLNAINTKPGADHKIGVDVAQRVRAQTQCLRMVHVPELSLSGAQRFYRSVFEDLPLQVRGNIIGHARNNM